MEAHTPSSKTLKNGLLSQPSWVLGDRLLLSGWNNAIVELTMGGEVNRFGWRVELGLRVSYKLNKNYR